MGAKRGLSTRFESDTLARAPHPRPVRAIKMRLRRELRMQYPVSPYSYHFWKAAVLLPLVGVLVAYSVDLILEPVAYITGMWTWLEPYTLQVYWGSTVANALVWMGMCLIGIKLWEVKHPSTRDGIRPRLTPLPLENRQ